MDGALSGRTLGGFKLEAPLGSGAMGTVYRAIQTSLGRGVAVKVLNPIHAGRPELAERFRREARAAARLDHPNIVQPIDFGEEAGSLFFAMELMEGASAAKRIEAGAAFAETEAIEVAVAVARALEYAEAQGIVHRDVKPDNILFDKRGTPKLADLGLVLVQRDFSARPLTEAGNAVGTVDYMAPEQLEGVRDLDVRSDVYALGISLYEMVTRKRPFTGDSPIAIALKHIEMPLPDPRKEAPALSERFVAIVAKMTAKRRDDRFQSARALREALELAGAAGLAASAAVLSGPLPVVAPSREEVAAAVTTRLPSGKQPLASSPAPAPALAPSPAPRSSRTPALAAAAVLALVALALAAYKLAPGPASPAAVAAATRPAARVAFGPPTPAVAIGAGFEIQGWRRVGPAAWGPDMEAEGEGTVLVAQGSGRLARDLGRGPWRLEGRIRLRGGAEAGVRADRADGRGAVALAVQGLGAVVVLKGERLGPDNPSGDPVRAGEIGSPRTISAADEIPFAIAVEDGWVFIEAAGAPLCDGPLEGGAAGASLYVVKSPGVEIAGLAVRRPK